ncbi:Acetyl-CoA carboxylase, putative [Cryptococcus gattii WM276]|uniref:Acetyl-CoA carboxylase, putative n=1 Tax=Cryptococcus gattii serotype B (strain WM276 / ATCC MYA-4071) TaxID=367775 RepID=E6R880_CRYGW|nr:Acetyl-CoA carboxylase, putative [Cryptococcus gattii WM276]ADV22983.1 Acetyl-CoA carboxylase, putative [Cryptococcus gattii WM276]
MSSATPNGSAVNGPSDIYDHSKVAQFIGANSVESAPSGRVTDFVKAHNGHTVITKVLIANNGIAAVKEIRSIRKWSYETFGSERQIEFTVMATPEDLRINAEYIRMADRYVEVPGGSNNNNYANVDFIVDVAERAGVHAVWAGWGHASENPRLPETLAKSKIVFIGPPGSAMRSLGDKISSTIVAQHAKVPCMAWSGTGISDTVLSPQGFVTVPDKAYDDACVHNWEEGLERAEKIGFPVMIKASEGGGGKGIRKVEDGEKFKNAFQAVAGEVPGSPIFIMKLAGSARHLEVQLIADQYGNAISLFGRDCSVQRRHQKIIEEAPVTIAKPDTFEEMEKAAVRLAKLVGYVSAGTVEYLYSHSDDSFYFLELNPRLQVEHPTTEMVSGCNIPAIQLQVAMGIPLHRIRDIRTLYGMDPHGITEIDFYGSKPESVNTQRKPTPKGHVIACRITGENPDAGFKPSSGNLTELNFRSNSNVWGYFSVSSAGGLHEYADSQFGHIFAYGMERSEARKSMVVALKELSIRGEFRTTVEYLIKLLEKPEFENNTLTTQWLDGLIAEGMTSERPDPVVAVVCGAVVKAYIAYEASLAKYKSVLDKGQVPSKDSLQTFFKSEFIYENVRYSFAMAKSSAYSFTLYLNGGRIFVGCRGLSDGGLLISLGGASHTVYFREEVGAMVLSVDSKTTLIEDEQDPSQLRSPSPGKLVRYLIDSGDHVNAGDAYAEIEVMKMIMPVTASESGIAQFMKQPGQTLAAGELLGILTLDDPTKVKFAKPFEGILPTFELKDGRYGTKPHQRLREHLEVLYDNLSGYDNSASVLSSLRIVEAALRDADLPYSNAQGVMSTLSGRIPQKLEEDIRSTLDSCRAKQLEFPSLKLQHIIDVFVEENVMPKERPQVIAAISPLKTLIDAFAHGLKVHEWQTWADLLNFFADVEEPFADTARTQENVILKLRDDCKDLDQVVNLVLSHSKIALKTKLVLALLDIIKSESPRASMTPESRVNDALGRLAALDSRPTAKVALKAKEVMIVGSLPSYEERLGQLERLLSAAVTTSYYGQQGSGHRLPSGDVLKEVTDSRYTVFDVLTTFFDHDDPWVALAALEVYVRRAYRVYNVLHLDYEAGEKGGEPHIITWRFKLGGHQSEPITPRVDSTKDFTRIASMSDLSYVVNTKTEPVRFGLMTSYNDLASLEQGFAKLLSMYPAFSHVEHIEKFGGDARHPHVMNVALRLFNGEQMSDIELNVRFHALANRYATGISGKGIRRVSFVICRKDQYPAYVTLRESAEGSWKEEEAIRDIEPALAYQLELGRLSNFKITPQPSSNRQIHVYHAVGRENTSDVRFFVRALLRPGRFQGNMQVKEYLISETDRLVGDILDTLEVVSSQHRQADCNHIMVNCVYNLNVTFDDIQEALAGFIERHGKRLWRLRVTQAEIRVVIEDEEGNVLPIRSFIENVSGFVVKYEAYQEIDNDKGKSILKSIGENGQFHLQPVNFPYSTKESLQPRRYQAHVIGTTYVYDFPDLFRQATDKAWHNLQAFLPNIKIPSDLLTATELVSDERGELQEVTRAPGLNTCGMVAWVYTLKTPEYPQGRRVVVISNDITYQIGSFGPAEDEFFYKATQYARKHGLPRIYLSANSGARIGLAEEVMALFDVAWHEAGKPEKGFDYLYLTPANLEKLNDMGSGSVITDEIEVNGERRHKIVSIIGLKDGLGVECLRGSGLIAGETSRAYDDIFTISMVTARSVGIGAYLVRLGQRVVQVEGQPIILTGAQAINKVLGKEVYTSNIQLGGPQIMYKNGISHLTAGSDLDGALQIINYLMFIPEQRGRAIPILPTGDHWDRAVEWKPTKAAYDPRNFLSGCNEDVDGVQSWKSGILDNGSFFETMGGWAQTIVTGRGRISGIPVAVIAAETRSIERVDPADPANENSQENRVSLAGTVWFPDSSRKTATAIEDANREGLPLVIFANFRGFSGGMSDMAQAILKEGAKIVDGLSSYKHPVIVYLVPNGELRGGAWVVLDPSINPEHMTMFVDNESRGGVLEPEGIVEVKYRKPKVQATMARLDEEYARLKKEVENPNASPEQKTAATAKLEAREKHLGPAYQSVALEFADLHDRSGRMKAKADCTPCDWENSRRAIYWSLRRKLSEIRILKKLENANPRLTYPQRKELLQQFVPAELSSDSEVAAYIEKSGETIESFIQGVRDEWCSDTLVSWAGTNQDGVMSGFKRILEGLSVEQKAQVLAELGVQSQA